MSMVNHIKASGWFASFYREAEVKGQTQTLVFHPLSGPASIKETVVTFAIILHLLGSIYSTFLLKYNDRKQKMFFCFRRFLAPHPTEISDTQRTSNVVC